MQSDRTASLAGVGARGAGAAAMAMGRIRCNVRQFARGFVAELSRQASQSRELANQAALAVTARAPTGLRARDSTPRICGYTFSHIILLRPT